MIHSDDKVGLIFIGIVATFMLAIFILFHIEDESKRRYELKKLELRIQKPTAERVLEGPKSDSETDDRIIEKDE